MDTKRVCEKASRVYEGGRYHYRFRCPECGQVKMFLAGIGMVREAPPGCDPQPRYSMHCSRCGAHRTLTELPLTQALEQSATDREAVQPARDASSSGTTSGTAIL